MSIEKGTGAVGPSKPFIRSCKKCNHGNKVTVEFPDGVFTFHAQWLHDARCDDGPARNVETAICQQPIETVQVQAVNVSGQGLNSTLDVTWDDGVFSKFPAPWLRVMAPVVARLDSPQSNESAKDPVAQGWLVSDLKIPEISYRDLFQEKPNLERDVEILDKILSPSASGIIRIVDLPPPDIASERAHQNNINTQVLKRLFASVFIHPIRGKDQTFNVSSHSHDATRKVGLPNYDTTQILLPHSDHAFYDNPIQVQGFYGLEGTSENTWVSVLAALHTMKEEHPELYPYLLKTPAAVGRVSRFYGEPLYQATVDVPVTALPGAPDEVKRFRWHPNLTGSLLASYDSYKAARAAYQKFQEVLRRPTHQLKMQLKPGDLYIWDNFRLLHGRERVLETPRTGVGQTVPEQVVHDRYRSLCVGWLRDLIGEEWLVHMPMMQLRDMMKLFKSGFYCADG
ncbi:MAG: hypothetical protein Q9225_003104 [Loekoesia sp. 1 TL-2023]